MAVTDFVKRIFNRQSGYYFLGTLDNSYTLSDLSTTPSSVVESCTGWVANTLPEAPLRRLRNIETDEISLDHSLLTLIARCNSIDVLENLLASTAESLMIDGNAYWLVERDVTTREPIGLWWIPISSIRITGSVYNPQYYVNEISVRRDNIIHFKKGLNRADQRFGISRLKAALLETKTDKEVTSWIFSYLHNGAVPGLIVTGKTATQGELPMSDDEASRLKEKVNAEFKGEGRGSLMVSSRELQVHQVGWKPDSLDFSPIYDLTETRICSLLGVPPIVISLNSGLKNSTYSNFVIAKRSAYESTVIPMQKLIASTISKHLFKDYNLSETEWELEFDNSRAQALREDPNNLSERINKSWLNGLITKNQALSALGWMPIGEEGDSYYEGKPSLEEIKTERVTKGEAQNA